MNKIIQLLGEGRTYKKSKVAKSKKTKKTKKTTASKIYRKPDTGPAPRRIAMKQRGLTAKKLNRIRARLIKQYPEINERQIASALTIFSEDFKPKKKSYKTTEEKILKQLKKKNRGELLEPLDVEPILGGPLLGGPTAVLVPTGPHTAPTTRTPSPSPATRPYRYSASPSRSASRSASRSVTPEGHISTSRHPIFHPSASSSRTPSRSASRSVTPEGHQTKSGRQVETKKEIKKETSRSKSQSLLPPRRSTSMPPLEAIPEEGNIGFLPTLPEKLPRDYSGEYGFGAGSTAQSSKLYTPVRRTDNYQGIVTLESAFKKSAPRN